MKCPGTCRIPKGIQQAWDPSLLAHGQALDTHTVSRCHHSHKNIEWKANKYNSCSVKGRLEYNIEQYECQMWSSSPLPCLISQIDFNWIHTELAYSTMGKEIWAQLLHSSSSRQPRARVGHAAAGCSSVIRGEGEDSLVIRWQIIPLLLGRVTVLLPHQLSGSFLLAYPVCSVCDFDCVLVCLCVKLWVCVRVCVCVCARRASLRRTPFNLMLCMMFHGSTLSDMSWYIN